MLLVPGQLDPDRAADGARQQGRVGPDVVHAAAAVGAGGLQPQHLDILDRHVQQDGKVGAQHPLGLGAGPDGQLPALVEGRHRTARPDRAVHLVGPDIGVGEAGLGRGQGGVDVAGVPQRPPRGRVGADRLGRRVEVGQVGEGVPLDAQGPGGGLGLLLPLGDDADEVVDHHHLHQARDMGDRGLVHGGEAAADEGAAVAPGVGRPDHPTVQHARQAHVVDIGHAPGRLARDVDPRNRAADDAVGGRVLQRDVLVQHQHGRLPGDQLGIGARTVGLAAARDLALDDDKVLDRQIQPLGRLFDQPSPRLGGGLAQGYGGELDRLAGGGVALVRGPGRVAQHHLDLTQGQVQLLGDDLGKGGADAGAQVDVPVEAGGRSVVEHDDEQFRRRLRLGPHHGQHALRCSSSATEPAGRVRFIPPLRPPAPGCGRRGARPPAPRRASRSGKGCSAAPGGSRRRWGRACGAGGPSPP